MWPSDWNNKNYAIKPNRAGKKKNDREESICENLAVKTKEKCEQQQQQQRKEPSYIYIYPFTVSLSCYLLVRLCVHFE